MGKVNSIELISPRQEAETRPLLGDEKKSLARKRLTVYLNPRGLHSSKTQFGGTSSFIFAAEWATSKGSTCPLKKRATAILF